MTKSNLDLLEAIAATEISVDTEVYESGGGYVYLGIDRYDGTEWYLLGTNENNFEQMEEALYEIAERLKNN